MSTGFLRVCRLYPRAAGLGVYEQHHQVSGSQHLGNELRDLLFLVASATFSASSRFDFGDPPSA